MLDSFKTYCLQEKAISKADIFKRDNISIFGNKILKGAPFIRSADNSEFIIGYRNKRKTEDLGKAFLRNPQETLDSFKSNRGSIELPIVSGGTIKLTDIKKTVEFGGKGKGFGTIAEDAALRGLNQDIFKILSDGGLPYINIRVNKQTYQIVHFETTPGTPKSDFHGYNIEGDEVLWVSHKKSGGASRIQQYVSITGRAKDYVNQHQYIKETLPKFVPYVDEIVEGSKRFFHKIPYNSLTKNLMLAAIYGNDFQGRFGRQHVQMIGQGKHVLKKIGEEKGIPVYDLSYDDHTGYSGDVKSFFDDSGYSPIILARPGSDRSFEANGVIYKKVRMLICPMDLKGTAKEIV